MDSFLESLIKMSEPERLEVYRRSKGAFSSVVEYARPVERPNMFNDPASQPHEYVVEASAFADWHVAAIMAGLFDENIVQGRFIARTSDARSDERIREATGFRRSELEKREINIDNDLRKRP